MPAKTKVYPVWIPQMPGFSRERWFLEVQVSDGTWRDVGNYDTRQEAVETGNKVQVCGNRWTLA